MANELTEEEINQKLLLLHQRQWELDNLYSSFSEIGKKQLINSFLFDEIISTNAIEEIHSTTQDVFSILVTNHNTKNKELLFITRAYQALFDKKKLKIDVPLDIRTLYDELLLPGIKKEDYPDGKYFRKEPVYISNGLKAIHTGFYPEERIEKGITSFIRLIHQDMDIYLKTILSHFLFETIHPFYDGNGRLGRYLFLLCY